MVVYVDTKKIMRELGVETKLMGEPGLYGRRCIKDLYGVGKNEVWNVTAGFHGTHLWR